MVQRYLDIVAQAEEKLIASIRKNLIVLKEKGYQGELDLGEPLLKTSRNEATSHRYLYQHGRIVYKTPRNSYDVSPDKIAFEMYPINILLDIGRDTEKAMESLKSIQPEPVAK